MFKEISKCIFVVIISVVHTTNAIYIRRALTRESDNFLGTDHTKMIKNDDTRFRKARYLYISKNGVLHPVINATTVAVHAGYATLIGLGFLSVLNTAAKQLSTKSSSSPNDDKDTESTDSSENNKANSNLTDSTTKYRRKRKRPFSYTFTTLPSVEPYDDIENDFNDEVDNDDKHDAEYEEELRLYEKDYEQYLKDYAEWDENYGDLYRNAESASIMVASSSSQLDSTNFGIKPSTRRRKQRYNNNNSERLKRHDF